MKPTSILITGASGGIGSALARVYAEPDVTLVLTGRDTSRLNDVADACRDLGAQIEVHTLDLRDTDRLRQWAGAISARHGIDLAIINAAISHSMADAESGEHWETIEAIIDTNLTAALATADSVLPTMRSRGSLNTRQ